MTKLNDARYPERPAAAGDLLVALRPRPGGGHEDVRLPVDSLPGLGGAPAGPPAPDFADAVRAVVMQMIQQGAGISISKVGGEIVIAAAPAVAAPAGDYIDPDYIDPDYI